MRWLGRGYVQLALVLPVLLVILLERSIGGRVFLVDTASSHAVYKAVHQAT